MSGFERAVVGISTWLMALTGTAYFVMKYLMTSDDPFSAFHHPWQPHALTLHVLGGPIAVFGLGLIARGHVLERYRDGRRRGRGTGVSITALAAPMVVSGYLLQAVTNDTAKRLLVGVHVAAAASYTLLFAAHLWVSRGPRSIVRQRASARRGSSPTARRPRP